MNKAKNVINILNEQREIKWTSPEEDSFEMENVEELLKALKRIAEHQYRADRRHKGMVDVSELEDIKRIARNAISKFFG